MPSSTPSERTHTILSYQNCERDEGKQSVNLRFLDTISYIAFGRLKLLVHSKTNIRLKETRAWTWSTIPTLYEWTFKGCFWSLACCHFSGVTVITWPRIELPSVTVLWRSMCLWSSFLPEVGEEFAVANLLILG